MESDPPFDVDKWVYDPDDRAYYPPHRNDYVMGEERKTQVGGDHYKKLKIQPLEYCLANDMGIMEHGVVKYVTRHQDKGGAEDIRKGIDYMIKILKIKYGEDYNV